MTAFNKRVFINCPFDDDYRQLLVSLIFTIKYLDFEPKLSLQSNDAGSSRLENIVELIRTSKFGIHDLSRIISSEAGEHVRMNMPFELGIDYGCKKFLDGGAQNKKILVLEKEKYRYQQALSDLSGSDIKNHDNDPMTLVRVVRDWFVTEELDTAVSHKVIWYAFNDFSFQLEIDLATKGFERDDFATVPIPEIMNYMTTWITNRKS
jgi:hypothetical protein